ncbi:hypothetical protein BASA61_005307 [Batrachochytrium salamandrivorans]|nr:hypothetical protein BASA61_005307 [Batrachochytrium salamandrivorans]
MPSLVVQYPGGFGNRGGSGSRCGQGVGPCGNGECCSSSNVCGTSAASCEVGCQPRFGLCTPGPTGRVPPPFDNRSNSPFRQHATPCTRPRIRKEFRTLTALERAAFVNGIHCLRKIPSGFPQDFGSKSAYDDFVYVHMISGGLAHNTASFFPWHRLYLQNFEDLLRVMCGYTAPLPYWDWTIDAAAPQNSPVWDASFMGGDGDPITSCIGTGPFRNMQGVHPAPHCVKRRFDLSHNMYSQFYTATEVNRIVTTSTSYHTFRDQIETRPHSSVHFSVGGDLAQAPISESAYQYATLYDKLQMMGLSGDMQVKDLMNTVGGGRFCYQYQNEVYPRQLRFAKRDGTSANFTLEELAKVNPDQF